MRKKTINFNKSLSLKFTKVLALPKRPLKPSRYLLPLKARSMRRCFPGFYKFRTTYTRLRYNLYYRRRYASRIIKLHFLRLRRRKDPSFTTLNWSRRTRKHWFKYSHRVSNMVLRLTKKFFKRSSLIRYSLLKSKLYRRFKKTWQKKLRSSPSRKSRTFSKIRIKSKRSVMSLKSNICVKGLNYRNLSFKWVKLNTNTFLSMQNLNLSFMVSDISNFNTNTRNFQTFIKTKSLQSSFLWINLYNSVVNWFYIHSSFFYNYIQINKHIYTNTSINHTSYFFHTNQLSNVDIQSTYNSLLTPFTSNDPETGTTSLTNLSTLKKNTSRGMIMVFMNAKNKKLQSSKPTNTRLIRRGFKSHNRWRRVLFLLSRYFHHLTLSKILRSKIRKKTCIFFLPKSMFFNKQLITINENFKCYHLAAFSSTPIVRRVFSNKGLKRFNQHLSNDNLIEQSTDFFLRSVNSQRIDNTILQLIQGYSAQFHTKVLKRSKLHLDQYKHRVMGNPQPLKFAIKTTTNSIKYSKSRIVLGDASLAPYLYKSPLLFKYFLWNRNTLSDKVSGILNKNTIGPVLLDLSKLNFSARSGFYQNSNLWPATMFKYTVKRKLLKMFNYYKFLPNVTMWYYNMLIRFMENCSGKKVYLKFNPFIENSLTFSDIARCRLWSMHTGSFQRMLGHRIFVNEALELFTIALKFKDPAFLANWIKQMLYRMSFWKYRLLFRYIKYMLRYFFWSVFPDLDFKGFKLKLKGKISVAGNARTRTLAYKIGETGYSRVNNRVLSDFTTVNTFTGVMGFRVWFFW